MTPHTRFSDLQDTLSKLGGEMLADIFATDESLLDYKAKAVEQGEGFSKAPMINPEFGLVSFTSAKAVDVQAKFNCLYGSSTRPHAILERADSDRLIGQKLYFDQLTAISKPLALKSQVG